MGIRAIAAMGFCVIAIGAQAAPTTNSWKYGGSSFWDADSDWSLGMAPNDTDVNGYDFITNAVSKVIQVDSDDVTYFYYELTVSNLTVAGFAGATNTLCLTNMNLGGDVPLTIINSLSFGNGGRLQFNDSMLQAYNAAFSTGSVLEVALGIDSSPVVVSNNLTLGGTLNVIDGGGFSNTTYTLFTYGGTLMYNGLTVGSVPANFTCAVSTGTAGQVDLVVSIAPPSSGSFQITSIARSTNDVTIAWTASAGGTDFVQAETEGTSGYNSNDFQTIATNVVVAGATNTYTDVGGATNGPSRFYRIYFPH